MKFHLWVLMVLFILFIVCRNGVVLSSDDRFINRYAVMKMYESCFGPQVVKEVRQDMRTAAAKCSGTMPLSVHSTSKVTSSNSLKNSHTYGMEPMKHHQVDNAFSSEHLKSHTTTNIDLTKLQQAILAGFNKHVSQSVYANNLNMGTGQAFGHIRPWSYTYPSIAGYSSYSHMNNFVPASQTGPLSAYTPSIFSYPNNPFYQSVLFSPFYGAGRESRELNIKGQLESLAMRVSGRMKNISCIMQELGYMNENLEPNYERIITKIKKLPVAEELKTEMMDGIEYCKQFSLCVPENRNDKYTRDMVKSMFFFKCYKHKKMEACILKDIRDRYSFDNLEDNMIAMDRSDRSNHDGNNDDIMELALYEFLYGTDDVDFQNEFL